MKIIFSNSVLSIVLKSVFLVLLLMIIFFMTREPPDLIPFWIVIMIFFQSSYLFMFNSLYGYIALKNDRIFVPNDFCVFKKFRIQHKLIAKVKDIIAIEFNSEECDSIGRQINIRFRNSIIKTIKLYKTPKL